MGSKQADPGSCNVKLIKIMIVEYYTSSSYMGNEV